MVQSLEKLIADLKGSGILRSSSIESALQKVDRKEFVIEEAKALAYEDRPLVTLEGQTISQPTTVVFMLELLAVEKGEKVLDIGAGSGWVSCLLAALVGKKGKVDAFELNKAVGKFGLENVKKSGLKNVNYKIEDAKLWWDKDAPYNKIYAGAAFQTLPFELLKCLKKEGIFVGPTQDGCVRKITRKGKKKFLAELYPGFRFVPFIEQE